jgi:hypothetical protein
MPPSRALDPKACVAYAGDHGGQSLPSDGMDRPHMTVGLRCFREP